MDSMLIKNPKISVSESNNDSFDKENKYISILVLFYYLVWCASGLCTHSSATSASHAVSSFENIKRFTK